jgi:hypothetical protein
MWITELIQTTLHLYTQEDSDQTLAAQGVCIRVIIALV